MNQIFFFNLLKMVALLISLFTSSLILLWESLELLISIYILSRIPAYFTQYILQVKHTAGLYKIQYWKWNITENQHWFSPIMPNINEIVRHALKIFCSIAIVLITNTYISLELSRLIREKYSYNALLLSNRVLLCLTHT